MYSSEEIPSTWLKISLGDVVNYGSALKAEPIGIADDTWVLELEDIEKNTSRVLQKIRFFDRKSKSTKNKFEAGDVLYGKLRPYLNKVVFADEAGVCTTEIVPIKGNQAINSKYLFYWLKHPVFINYVTEVSHGVNMPRLGTDAGKQAPLVLAPLAEQRRITDKLDTTLARVDALKDRLARITPLLKRFRQSVLAAATSGRLTEDWRIEISPQPVIESELIRIRETFATSSKETRIIKDLIERSIYSLPKDGIPNEWLKTCIGMAGVVSNGSTPSRAVAEYWNGKISWVSSGEVRNKLILETKEKISQSGFESSSVRLLPIGTVLIAMIGEGKTRGQSALLGIEATINQNIAAVVPLESLLIPKYLWYWFQSQYENNRQAGNGTGPQALNCQKVRELPLNLPPVVEQTEIVRRVETLFAFADRLEARLQSAQTAAERLTPALLAKAFRGELVPQDPSDEPATELLHRLREALAADTPSRKPRKTTTARR